MDSYVEGEEGGQLCRGKREDRYNMDGGWTDM